MLQPGTVVDGQFEIVCSVGSGAQATVYRAIDLHLQRTVALKIMHVDAEDLDSEQRFQREARLISLLQHPNILRCYKFGHFEGSLYTCVDFFDGNSLATVLNAGPMPWRRALKICAEVAKGMQHAHDQGVVHRDLTPRNIMISSKTAGTDQVKVVDFGLGKWLGTDASYQKLTQTGDVIGSIFCMSPEQCSGKETDGRTDVYSLGCVLYTCLTGEPPFLALEAIAMMQKHFFEEVSPPCALAESGCPVLVDKVTAKALAKSADDRYQTMADFAFDLEAVLQGKALGTTTAAFAAVNRTQRSNGAVVPTIVAGIFLLLIVLFKTQIVCLLLSLTPPATACLMARQLVQGSWPLTPDDKTEIAVQGARIAERTNISNPDAVALYARSDRGHASSASDVEAAHGSLMALRTLSNLSTTNPTIAPAEFNKLATLTLNEIPSNCRNHEVCRLCFAMVPLLDASLGAKYVQKGLDITDTARDQGGLGLIAQLYFYSAYIDRSESGTLKLPVGERCLKALTNIPPNEPGRAMGCYQTASLLPYTHPRRLALLTECSRQAEAEMDKSEPAFSQAQLTQINCWRGFEYQSMKDYNNARRCFLWAIQHGSLKASEFTDRATELAFLTALVSGPASGREVLKRFPPAPDRAAAVLRSYQENRSERFMAVEMIIALPVKTKRQAVSYVDARINRASYLAEKNRMDQAMRELRSVLAYIKVNRLMASEDKPAPIANATSILIQLTMKDKARVKETMALLDSLEDIPPSLKDYCFQRDTVRAHMMRNAGRFAEGQALLNSMIMRYATTLDAARIQREIGHLKLVQGKFDEAIACYKESQALLATLVGAKSLRYLEAEVAETQRSLTFAQAQKKGR